MTMTDTEAKALALVKDLRMSMTLGGKLSRPFLQITADAADYIEATEARHAAELREQAERFSEAVRYCIGQGMAGHHRETLEQFILPAPDPLVEEEDPIDALVDLLAPVLTHSQGMAARERESSFRNALAALRKIGEAGE